MHLYWNVERCKLPIFLLDHLLVQCLVLFKQLINIEVSLLVHQLILLLAVSLLLLVDLDQSLLH
jgi:hypothetical protein